MVNESQVAESQVTEHMERAKRNSANGARLRKRLKTTARYVPLVVAAVIVLFPVYVTFLSSVLAPEDFLSNETKLFTLDPDWSNYSVLFTDGHIDKYMMNSAIVAVTITLVQIFTSILAGYAFAFLNFPGRRTIFALFISTLMIPWEVTVVSNFRTIDSWGWTNSYPALIVPFLATAMGTFLVRQGLMGLPGELRDAAKLDGLGHWAFLTKVAVPLVRPAIGALGVLSFLAAWNQYLWPRLVTDSPAHQTVQVGLRSLGGDVGNGLSVQFAGSIVASLPIFLLLLIFQRQLVRGLTAGAVKG